MSYLNTIDQYTTVVFNGKDIPSNDGANIGWGGGKGYLFMTLAALGVWPAGTIDTGSYVKASFLFPNSLQLPIAVLDPSTPSLQVIVPFDLPQGQIIFDASGSGAGITGLLAGIMKFPN